MSLPVRLLLLLMFSAVAGGRVDVAELFAAAHGDAEVAAEDVVGKATGGRDHDLRLLLCQNRCLVATGNCRMD